MRRPHLPARFKAEVHRIDSDHPLRAQVAERVNSQQADRPLPHHRHILVDDTTQFADGPDDGPQRLSHQDAVVPLVVDERHRNRFV